MTNVLFYHGVLNRLQATAHCLLHLGDRYKYAPLELKTVVFIPDRASSERLDQLLWTHSALSFLPHCQMSSPLAAETPIVLVNDLQQAPKEGRLLNLSNEIPDDFASFSELIEIISQESAVRLPARERVRVYREGGHAIQYRDLLKDPL